MLNKSASLTESEIKKRPTAPFPISPRGEKLQTDGNLSPVEENKERTSSETFQPPVFKRERSGSKLLPNFLKPRRKTELKVSEVGSVGFAHLSNQTQSHTWNGQEGDEVFEKLEQIGTGALGTVFKVKCRSTGEVMAAKIIKHSRIDPMKAQDIRKEILLFPKYQHECLVKYHGFCTTREEFLWIITDYCPAGSLSSILKVVDKPLSEDQIAIILSQVLKGLAFLHNVCVAHRDLRCSNILLMEDGSVKLNDFGVFSSSSTPMSPSSAPFLTSDYSSSIKTDVWFVGVVALEMAKKQLTQELVDVFQQPTNLTSGLESWSFSEQFKTFLSLCFASNVDTRPTALELLEDPFIAEAKDRNLLVPLINYFDVLKSIQKSESIISSLDNEEGQKLKQISDLTKSTSRLTLTDPATSSSTTIRNIGPPSMLNMQSLIADCDVVVALLDIKGFMPKAVKKSIGVQTEDTIEPSHSIEQSKLTQFQPQTIEATQRKVLLDKMKSELAEKNNKITQLNTQVSDLKHEVLNRGERARLSSSRIKAESSFVRGDVPRMDSSLMFSMELSDEETSSVSLSVSPPYRLPASAPTQYGFPRRGLAPWARGRAASVEDLGSVSMDSSPQMKSGLRKMTLAPVLSAPWVTQPNRKSLEMEDATLAAELKRRSSGRINSKT